MSLQPARCLVTRGCGAGERACERVCAAGAVEVHGVESAAPGPRIRANACHRCLLCVRACPSGAIEDTDGDLRVAAAIRAHLGDSPEILFRCQDRLAIRAGAEPRPTSDGGAVEVPCLGALGVGVLALAAAWGARSLRFDDRHCAGCARRPGLRLARHAAHRAKRLIAVFGGEVDFHFESRAPAGSRPPAARRPNRRGILGLVLNGLAERLAPMPELAPAGCAPRDRQMLRHAVQALGVPAERFVGQGEAALWSLAATGACDGCGACAALCPTGALQFRESQGEATLAFDILRCTGCQLCTARCPRGALAERASVDTGDLARPPVMLMRSERGACDQCAQPLQVPAGLCADCRLKCALAAQFVRSPRKTKEAQ